MEANVAQHAFNGRDDDATRNTTRSGIDDVTSAVYIIDGDRSTRELLALLIRTAGWEPEYFDSAEAFLTCAASNGPCCLILDVALPGMSGLELQKQLAGRPDVPLIFITSHTEVPMVVQAMKAGAVEFLAKPVNGVALVHAIRTAIERSRVARHHGSEMRRLGHCYSSLTPREREVMVRVVSGLLNKQVGFELGISEVTVKAHRGRVMRKMQADSLPELVTMATRLGLRPGPVPR